MEVDRTGLKRRPRKTWWSSVKGVLRCCEGMRRFGTDGEMSVRPVWHGVAIELSDSELTGSIPGHSVVMQRP